MSKGPDVPIRPHKAELFDHAIRTHGITSFADLGGCWGVNAGYTLHALARHPSIQRAYVADQHVTPLSRQRGAAYPQLAFLTGIINRAEFVEAFPAVDALVMYDILLHQVNLNWDAFLSAWATKARVLVIYNQNWSLDPRTVRFIDRGRDWYKQYVFHTRAEAIDQWFDQHDVIDPQLNCPRRDVHNFWQWGITRDDLIAHVEGLGFRLTYFQDYGPFMNVAHIPQQGFVFVRK
ncbi:hypothetical protein [Sinimarinibacterium flocculans]|uniref:hypothetical protein n=1 Tax=Sinimarinibacterium flocculans TaxID=985250 RepID=UPI003515F818